MNALMRFLLMSREEKKRAVCRRAYRVLHKRQFGQLGKHSYIWNPLLVLNRKYMYIGTECSIYPMARIECITDWGGGSIFSKAADRGLLCIWPAAAHDMCK